MKRHLLSATLALLLPAAAQAQTGTATVNANGNWSSTGTWTSTPAGFAPINGQNGQNWNAIINNSSRTVTVDAATTLEGLTFSAGAIQGANTLTLNAASTWSGGIFSTAGGITNFDGGVTITANSQTIDARTINLSGTSSIGAGTLNMGGGATLANSGTFNISNASALQFVNLGGGTVSNTGTGIINKSGAGTATVAGGLSFSNAGTVNVDAGILAVTGGAANGTFDIDAGAEFQMVGGNFSTYTMNADVKIMGAGIFKQSATSVGSTMIFNGVSTGSDGNLGLTNGAMSFSTGASFETTGSFTMTGGEIRGAGTATFGALSQWSGGNIGNAGGTLHFKGGLNIVANGQELSAQTVILEGTSSIGSGTLNANNTGVINNKGTLNINNATALNIQVFSGNTINNTGTVNKTNAGTATTQGVFNNNFVNGAEPGVVNVDAGILAVSGGSANGTFDIDAGAEFRMVGGNMTTYTMNAGVKIMGDGIFKHSPSSVGSTMIFNGVSTGSDGNLGLTNGTMTVSTGASFETSGSFVSTGGGLNGAGTMTFGSLSTWSGGHFQGSGTKNFNGGVNISASTQDLAGTVNMSGTSSIGSGTLVFLSGVLTNNGTFNMNNASALNFANGGTFTNTGTGIINKSGAGTFTGSGTLNNTGTLSVTQGVFLNTGSVTQHSGTTLTAGTWNVSNGATLTFSSGSNITTIGSNANVMFDGAGSTFAKINTLTTNQGGFTLKNDRDFTTTGAFSNSGSVTVDGSTTALTVGSGGSAAYTQTIGETVLVGGALIDASVFNLNGGELKGTGTIASSVITSGSTVIAPGQSPGALTIEGDLTLSAGNTLAMEIGGLMQGTEYDYIDVNGTLTLAGLLDLDFLDGFENTITYGDILTLATANSPILGAFSNVASGGRLWTNTDISFDVWYGAGSIYGENNLVITGAPEPSRSVLVLLGAAGLLMRRQRRRAGAL